MEANTLFINPSTAQPCTVETTTSSEYKNLPHNYPKKFAYVGCHSHLFADAIANNTQCEKTDSALEKKEYKYLKKEDLFKYENSFRDNYLQAIEDYRKIDPEDYVLQELCNFAHANVRIAFIGYYFELLYFMTRNNIEESITDGLDPLQCYVQSAYDSDYRNQPNSIILCPLHDSEFHVLTRYDYEKSDGLYVYDAKIAAYRALSPRDYLLQTLCDLAESAIVIVDIACNYPKHLFLKRGSVEYLFNENLSHLRRYVQREYPSV